MCEEFFFLQKLSTLVNDKIDFLAFNSQILEAFRLKALIKFSLTSEFLKNPTTTFTCANVT